MLHIHTPLVESTSLSREASTRVRVKLENLQPSGSFKIRGIGLYCERALERGARRLLSSSGGNAGLAAAYAGARLGMPVTVVVPETTAARMRSLIADQGAEVIVAGKDWDGAHQRALQLAGEGDVAYVHPFDHEDVWEGNATLVDELVDESAEPAWIVVAVGGGGLLGGILLGLDRAGWTRVRVLAVETEGAASLATSLRAGRVVELDRITSIAKTLGARRVSETVLAHALERGVGSRLVSDREAVAAVARFADDHRYLVEPSCGAALAAVYGWAPAESADGDVIVIGCGGAAVTLEEIDGWQRLLGM